MIMLHIFTQETQKKINFEKKVNRKALVNYFTSINEDIQYNKYALESFRNQTFTSLDNKTDLRTLYGFTNQVRKYDNKNIVLLNGLDNRVDIYNGTVNNAIGTNSQLNIATTKNIERAIGTISNISFSSGASNSENIISYSSNFNLSSNYSGEITNLINYDANTYYDSNNNFKVLNHYGLRLGNIDLGTQSNYAIYTNAGLNSFGDDVQIRNINSQVSTDPNHKVVVADADGTLRVSDASLNPNPASNAWTLNGNAGTDPDNNFIGTTDNKPLNFRTYESNKMTITPDGRVGIGTDNPKALFEVETQAENNGSGMGYANDISFTHYINNTPLNDPMTIHINMFDGSKGNPENLKINTYLYNSFFNAYINGSLTRTVYFGSKYRGDGTTNKSNYFIGVSGASNDFHIKENHNIGIGTSDPQEKLDVAGNVKAEKGIFTNLPEYTNHTDAMNDTALVTGALYIVRTADDAKQVFVK